MKSEAKKPLSPEKLAANRANAGKSTGPKTPAGKERSSQNSWKHGAFAKRLFKSDDQEAEDREDYETLLDGVFDHYQPVGPIESYWTERIAVEMLRSMRLGAHEQDSLGPMQFISAAVPIETVLRVQAANTRQLELAIKQLERLQQKRESSSPNESAENQNDLQTTGLAENAAAGTDTPTAEASHLENYETKPNLVDESDPKAPSGTPCERLGG